MLFQTVRLRAQRERCDAIFDLQQKITKLRQQVKEIKASSGSDSDDEIAELHECIAELTTQKKDIQEQLKQ